MIECFVMSLKKQPRRKEGEHNSGEWGNTVTTPPPVLKHMEMETWNTGDLVKLVCFESLFKAGGPWEPKKNSHKKEPKRQGVDEFWSDHAPARRRWRGVPFETPSFGSPAPPPSL